MGLLWKPSLSQEKGRASSGTYLFPLVCPHFCQPESHELQLLSCRHETPKTHVQDGKVGTAPNLHGLIGVPCQPQTASFPTVSSLWLNHHHRQIPLTRNPRQSKAIQPPFRAIGMSEWNEASKLMKIKDLKYLLYPNLLTCPNWDDRKNSRDWKADFQSSL